MKLTYKRSSSKSCQKPRSELPARGRAKRRSLGKPGKGIGNIPGDGNELLTCWDKYAFGNGQDLEGVPIKLTV
jgi:hypothetical protein